MTSRRMGLAKISMSARFSVSSYLRITFPVVEFRRIALQFELYYVGMVLVGLRLGLHNQLASLSALTQVVGSSGW